MFLVPDRRICKNRRSGRRQTWNCGSIVD